MRILHVITMLDIGGAERLMVDLLPRLKEKGHQVELLLFNGVETQFRKDLEKQAIRIYELSIDNSVDNRKPIYNPLNIFKLRKYLCGYDIIHTHNTACQVYVPIAKSIFGSKAKLVTTEHNSTNRRRSMRCFKPMDCWMYNQYAAIVCISDKASQNLRLYIGNRDNIVTIYNGIDIKRFIRPIKTISPCGNHVITMVAGFRGQKDHKTAIRAMTHLPLNYSLQLVGYGETEGEIRAMVAQCGLEKRVSFLGVRSDVPDILEKSDISLLSSHWEGLSLSSIEGMACGRPFIASDVDGLHEIVEGVGLLFPHGDDKALAESIQGVCENPTLYREVAEACQKQAEKYDISSMADAYHELYLSLIN